MKRMGALRVRDTGAPRFAAVTDSEIVQRVASAASATVLRLWTTVASAVQFVLAALRLQQLRSWAYRVRTGKARAGGAQAE